MIKQTWWQVCGVVLGSLAVGVGLVPVLFFGTWGILSLILETIWPAEGILWSLSLTIHYGLMFFLLGWRVNAWFTKKQWAASSIYLTTFVCLPMMTWLYLFAAITDATMVEYIPRFTWVNAPLIGYILGLIYRHTH